LRCWIINRKYTVWVAGRNSIANRILTVGIEREREITFLFSRYYEVNPIAITSVIIEKCLSTQIRGYSRLLNRSDRGRTKKRLERQSVCLSSFNRAYYFAFKITGCAQRIGVWRYELWSRKSTIVEITQKQLPAWISHVSRAPQRRRLFIRANWAAFRRWERMMFQAEFSSFVRAI